MGGIKLSRALARWRISSLSAAWQAWAAFVDDRCAKKAELAAAVGRLVNVRIAAAWASWQQAAERQRCKAEMLHAAAGFWFNHRLAAAFSMWQEHAQTRQVTLRGYEVWLLLHVCHKHISAYSNTQT